VSDPTPDGGISSLGGFFPRIRKAYLIGEAPNDFATQLEGRAPHVVAGTMERLETAARDAAEADVAEPVVLLSPACASFDQFRNFEVRGDAFANWCGGCRKWFTVDRIFCSLRLSGSFAGANRKLKTAAAKSRC
jgi:UDP-N-acetylmuramoylalanine-D-glutamate ligase